MAFFDGEGGAEVYNAATTETQALEVFRPAKAIIEMVSEMESEFGIEANAKEPLPVEHAVAGQPGNRQAEGREGAALRHE